MAFKIKASDDKRVTEAFAQLTIRRNNLENARIAFNDAIGIAREILQAEVDAHNEQSEATRGLLEDIHRELEEEFDAKSDKWKDSDKSESVKEWIEKVGDMVESVEDASIDSFPEAIESDGILAEDDPAEQYAEMDKEPQE